MTEKPTSPAARIKYFGRRIFGATKSPLWQVVHALTGHRLQGAVEYFDVALFGGYFEADARSVAERLPAGFEVVEHRPGLTEIELWCGQYRRIDILQPYNELCIFAPVRFSPDDGTAVTGSYALQMPVTSEEARWTGVNNYGFPKILAEIQLIDDGIRTTCMVRHRGVHVLTVRVEALATEPFEDTATILNVRDDARVIECTFRTAGDRGIRHDAGGVTLELGSHAIADELRRIGLRLDAGRGLYVPHGRAWLSRGIDLGLLPARGRASFRREEQSSRAAAPAE